jgi:hypothetical protein
MSYSILNQKKTILHPNSEFERRIILQYYLDNDIEISAVEREILENTTVSEHESIGIIGCLLGDLSDLNVLRLAIGAKNRSNQKLATTASAKINQTIIDKAFNTYFIDKNFDDLTEIERIVSGEFNLI